MVICNGYFSALVLFERDGCFQQMHFGNFSPHQFNVGYTEHCCMWDFPVGLLWKSVQMCPRVCTYYLCAIFSWDYPTSTLRFTHCVFNSSHVFVSESSEWMPADVHQLHTGFHTQVCLLNAYRNGGQGRFVSSSKDAWRWKSSSWESSKKITRYQKHIHHDFDLPFRAFRPAMW